MKADLLGRINYVPPNSLWQRGYSVCYSCGKDMPKVWDVVCFKCDHTFCYDCSIAFNNRWYCKKCFKEVYGSTLTGQQILFGIAFKEFVDAFIGSLPFIGRRVKCK